jgi:excisionase family DNA binding protein
MSEEQVLTIKEIAEILKLAEKTVYSMAQDGELPTFKVRGQWRIRKVDFEKWMTTQAATGAKQPTPQVRAKKTKARKKP